MTSTESLHSESSVIKDDTNEKADPEVGFPNPALHRRNNGAGERSRTLDLLITNELLYQLSYTGVSAIPDSRKPLDTAKPAILAQYFETMEGGASCFLHGRVGAPFCGFFGGTSGSEPAKRRRREPARTRSCHDAGIVNVMNPKRILVVGDAMLDRYWGGAVDRLSRDSLAPVLRVTRRVDRPRRGRQRRPGEPGGAPGPRRRCCWRRSVATRRPTRWPALLREAGVAFERVDDDPAYATTEKIRCVSRDGHLLRADVEMPLPEAMRPAIAARFRCAAGEPRHRRDVRPRERRARRLRGVDRRRARRGPGRCWSTRAAATGPATRARCS